MILKPCAFIFLSIAVCIESFAGPPCSKFEKQIGKYVTFTYPDVADCLGSKTHGIITGVDSRSGDVYFRVTHAEGCKLAFEELTRGKSSFLCYVKPEYVSVSSTPPSRPPLVIRHLYQSQMNSDGLIVHTYDCGNGSKANINHWSRNSTAPYWPEGSGKSYPNMDLAATDACQHKLR